MTPHWINPYLVDKKKDYPEDPRFGNACSCNSYWPRKEIFSHGKFEK